MKIYSTRLSKLTSKEDILDQFIGKDVWIALRYPYLDNAYLYINIYGKFQQDSEDYYEVYKFCISQNTELPRKLYGYSVEKACDSTHVLRVDWCAAHLVRPIEILSTDEVFDFSE